jgi:hypothetical protein
MAGVKRGNDMLRLTLIRPFRPPLSRKREKGGPRGMSPLGAPPLPLAGEGWGEGKS